MRTNSIKSGTTASQTMSEQTNPVDPIIAAIDAYLAGNEAFKGCPDHLTEEEERELIAATFGPADDALRTWAQPARTRDGAAAALKVAREEARMFGASDIITSMIDAALGYMAPPGCLPVTKVNTLARELSYAMTDWCDDLGDDGQPDIWKAHVFPSSMTKWAVSFEHIGTHHHFGDRIDTLFHEWRNMREAPVLADTGEEWEAHCARYSELQRRIEAVEPLSITDLAMQYYALTDDGSSDLSDAFEKRIFRLAGVETAEEVQP